MGAFILQKHSQYLQQKSYGLHSQKYLLYGPSQKRLSISNLTEEKWDHVDITYNEYIYWHILFS